MAKKPAKKSAKKSASKSSSKSKMTARSSSSPTSVTKVRSASRPKNSQSYTQSEFIENIRGFCGLPKRSQARELVEDIANFIRDSVRRGYKVPLMGLGKLYVRQSKARLGRNPATGETIQIPARKRVRFTAAKKFKEAVL